MTKPVYDGALVNAARAIRELYPVCGYDPAPHYQPGAPIDPLHIEHADLLAKGYAAIKYAVSKVLQPKRIVEVGVGYGCSARAFMDGQPGASYIGIDNSEHRPGIVDLARKTLEEFNAIILDEDSQKLTAFPLCDLCHVDADHKFKSCYHDTSLALRCAEWVLVDDIRDNVVAAAALKACMDWRAGELDWCVFEDSWTGSLLIHTTLDVRVAAK